MDFKVLKRKLINAFSPYWDVTEVTLHVLYDAKKKETRLQAWVHANHNNERVCCPVLFGRAKKRYSTIEILGPISKALAEERRLGNLHKLPF